MDRLLADLNEDDRPVIELSLQGYTVREISQRLDRVERTVRRTRERVRLRLERMQNRTLCEVEGRCDRGPARARSVEAAW